MRSIVIAGLIATHAHAFAEEPPPKPAPGVTLPAGKLNVTLTAELNATDGAFGKPVSFAPDVSYGVTRELTLALVSSTFATTGFRGSAGLGLCVTGTSHGCLKPWNNGGLEAHYALARGGFALAAVAGLHGTNLDVGWWAAKIGARLRAGFAGPFAVVSNPSVFVALTDRDATVKQKDTLWLPVMLTVKVQGLTAGLGSGIKGPLEGFGDAWTVPVGVSATYAFSPRATAGASWVFGKLAAASAVAAPKGLDQRALQVWFALTI